jgi:uncharacterized protein (TIGR03435 family)
LGLQRAIVSAGVAVLAAGIFCQSAPAPSFEVAVVKLSKPGTRGFIGVRPGNQKFEATNASLRSIIMMAYDITERQISGGPGWLESDGFDIEAKADAPATREQICLMVQTLLADRFKLRLDRVEREESVYALLADNRSPKLTLHKQQDGMQPLIRGGGSYGTILFQNVPMSRLAWFLSTQVGRSVVDKTGLEGSYDFTLDYMPEGSSKGGGSPEPPANDGAAPPPPSRPGILAAVQEQLGLRLESQKGMVGYFRVERVEKPSGT